MNIEQRNRILFRVYNTLYSGTQLWVPVMISYGIYRGMTIEQVFLMWMVYRVLVVVLEFPTGVIGDYFSHKFSVIIGSLIFGVSLILFSFSVNIWFYFLLMITSAVGVALVSGSDTAILAGITQDYKRESGILKSLFLFSQSVAFSIGGVLGSANQALPFLITGILVLGSVLSMSLIKYENQEKDLEKASIIQFTKGTLKYVLHEKKLLSLLIVTSFITATGVIVRMVYTPVFEWFKLPITYWGFIMSLYVLAQAFGSIIARKLEEKHAFLFIFINILGLILILCFNNVWIVLIGFAIASFCWGLVNTVLDSIIVKIVVAKRRASVFSLGSLLDRLVMVFATIIIGKTLGVLDIRMNLIIVASLLVIPFALTLVRMFSVYAIKSS